MPRFAILEHTGAPDDAAGRHVDLLVETGGSCRTWRLLQVPVTGGDSVAAAEIAPHRLAWLDHVAGEVSGGRGFARRIDAGRCEILSADAADLSAATQFVVRLEGGSLVGRLRMETAGEGWAATLVGDE
ncbi:MAG: hypothetical protein EBZ59_02370 [Planctomycetia bacterium]|nr:hypothetical protein [Planctomycetia bacterium]